jgi:integrase
MSSAAWTYTPTRHKTANHGKERVIYLGPKAQLIVKPYLADCPPDQFLFSPIRERQKRFAELRGQRQSQVQPSQVDRSKPQPRLLPSKQYNPKVLAHNVALACKKAGVSSWFPYQLRHSFATKIRRQHGLEAAQVLLGHSKADMTQIYAERDHAKAREVVAMVG